MNDLHPFAIYAAVQAHLGKPLTFPGNFESWQNEPMHATAILTGYLSEWAVLEDKCQNKAFNATDTSPLPWNRFWPGLAQWYGVKEVRFQSSFSPCKASCYNSIPKPYRQISGASLKRGLKAEIRNRMEILPDSALPQDFEKYVDYAIKCGQELKANGICNARPYHTASIFQAFSNLPRAANLDAQADTIMTMNALLKADCGGDSDHRGRVRDALQEVSRHPAHSRDLRSGYDIQNQLWSSAGTNTSTFICMADVTRCLNATRML